METTTILLFIFTSVTLNSFAQIFWKKGVKRPIIKIELLTGNSVTAYEIPLNISSSYKEEKGATRELYEEENKRTNEIPCKFMRRTYMFRVKCLEDALFGKIQRLSDKDFYDIKLLFDLAKDLDIGYLEKVVGEDKWERFIKKASVRVPAVNLRQ